MLNHTQDRSFDNILDKLEASFTGISHVSLEIVIIVRFREDLREDISVCDKISKEKLLSHLHVVLGRNNNLVLSMHYLTLHLWYRHFLFTWIVLLKLAHRLVNFIDKLLNSRQALLFHLRFNDLWNYFSLWIGNVNVSQGLDNFSCWLLEIWFYLRDFMKHLCLVILDDVIDTVFDITIKTNTNLKILPNARVFRQVRVILRRINKSSSV